MKSMPVLMGGIALVVLWGLTSAGATDDPITRLAEDDKPYHSATDSPRLYDPDREEILRGIIVNVDTAKPTEESSPFVQLDVKSGDTTERVHLAPQWFMEEYGHRLDLQKGYEVEIRGARNVVNGQAVFIAAEIWRPEQADERVLLRHQDGTPVWSGGERVS